MLAFTANGLAVILYRYKKNNTILSLLLLPDSFWKRKYLHRNPTEKPLSGRTKEPAVSTPNKKKKMKKRKTCSFS